MSNSERSGTTTEVHLERAFLSPCSTLVLTSLTPDLNVHQSISTCGENFGVPGRHGTHVAGSIASRSTDYPGIAPDVTLINVKVLRSDGKGRHTDIARGVDAALDRGAEVLCMSLGFNHLPRWSHDGHGWDCSDGRCPLCTAVDNAAYGDDVVAVVAAGNEHQNAQALIDNGDGHSFDTELCCPGQARQALTVGAITKRNFLPASFSSRGPTSYGITKPDLVTAGVNITSTVPVRRDDQGQPVSNPGAADLFGRLSGTSMATPIIAGAVALLIQLQKNQGAGWTSAGIRNQLLRKAVVPLPQPANVVGDGRLTLGRI